MPSITTDHTGPLKYSAERDSLHRDPTRDDYGASLKKLGELASAMRDHADQRDSNQLFGAIFKAVAPDSYSGISMTPIFSEEKFVDLSAAAAPSKAGATLGWRAPPGLYAFLEAMEELRVRLPEDVCHMLSARYDEQTQKYRVAQRHEAAAGGKITLPPDEWDEGSHQEGQ